MTAAKANSRGAIVKEVAASGADLKVAPPVSPAVRAESSARCNAAAPQALEQDSHRRHTSQAVLGIGWKN